MFNNESLVWIVIFICACCCYSHKISSSIFVYILGTYKLNTRWDDVSKWLLNVQNVYSIYINILQSESLIILQDNGQFYYNKNIFSKWPETRLKRLYMKSRSLICVLSNWFACRWVTAMIFILYKSRATK